MYNKKNKKAPRYDGIDSQPWQVVNVHGKVYWFEFWTEDGTVVERQWNSYRRAAYLARKVGGFAVRA